MTKPIIKICGVRTLNIAHEAALLGAQLIGMVFHAHSKRYVTLEQAIAISKATKACNAIPVAVFVDHTAEQMQDVCTTADIQVVQLHGSKARSEHHLLPKTYQRLYVRPVLPNADIIEDTDNGLDHCDCHRDYLLFDNAIAGIGKSFNWDNFVYNGTFRLGVAGGLTATNVTQAIRKFQPALVDVSSGVENITGEKDLTLIKKFIDAVHACKEEE